MNKPIGIKSNETYTKHVPGTAGRTDHKLIWTKFPEPSVNSWQMEVTSHFCADYNSEIHIAYVDEKPKYMIHYLYDRVNQRETARLECADPRVDLATLTKTTMKERENFLRFLKAIADDCHFGFTSDEIRDHYMEGLTKEGKAKQQKELDDILAGKSDKKEDAKK